MRSLFSRRGSNVIEFALTLPFLTVIMGLTVDYGWFFHRQFHMTNACNVAAQAAASNYGDSQSTSTAMSTGAVAGADAWTATKLQGQPSIQVGTEGAVPDLLFVANCAMEYNSLFNTNALANLMLGGGQANVLPTSNQHVAVRRAMNQLTVSP